MRRGLVLPFAFLLVVGMLPFAGTPSSAQEADDQRCIHPPETNESYEWAYNLSNGRTRYVEVIDEGLATTPRGRYNVTTLGFEEQGENGQRKAWGRQVRYAPDAPYYAWSLATQDRWERTDAGEKARKMDSFDPPFQIIHRGQETCPGNRWQFTTHHTIQYGEYGTAGREGANETWQVAARQWTNVTVPNGTFEVLPVTAVREADRYEINTYWSPRAEAPAKIVQGPGGTPQLTHELTWHILDQRPTAIFEATPLHPRVGHTITLNATASWDPEGNITDYRWLVGDETYHGRVVRFKATEEGTLSMRLFVTDEANRTSTLSTTRYVAPEQGSGVGISGPTEAVERQTVRLTAHPSFDPVEIRWRDGSTVVGKGETYSFYMNETVTLSVDAFHESGRVETANHTVELIERRQDSNDSREPGRTSYPVGGSADLAILEPLEGQVVPQSLTIRVLTKGQASLYADDRPLWQGTADPPESVPVTLDPGAHQLRLVADAERHVVNVTVSEDAPSDDTDPDVQDNGSDDPGGQDRAPSLPAAALVGLLAAIAWVRARF